jgi:hypothetical protein
MSRLPHGGDGQTPEQLQADLVARLRARRPEIEGAIAARVIAMSEPIGDEDADYIEGMRAAVTAAVDLSLTGLESGEQWSAPTPPAAVAQARRAARYGVSLDAVLRRFAAGDRLLMDFVIEEAGRDHCPSEDLRRILRAHGVLVDRVLASISAEYTQEADRVRRAPERRRSERVQALLAGTPTSVDGLEYEFDAWHLGIVAAGARGVAVAEELGIALGCQILSVPRWDEPVWVWLGGQRKLEFADVERSLTVKPGAGVALAVGEVAHGLEGWRMTHWQAQRALWVALRSANALTRYADVLLLAPVLRDDVLARSLNEIYLAPLARSQRDGGAASRETLRRYFAVGRNAAAAAAALKVDRHTVKRRLQRIEECLGRALLTCQAELELALRMEALGESAEVKSQSLQKPAQA